MQLITRDLHPSSWSFITNWLVRLIIIDNIITIQISYPKGLLNPRELTYIQSTTSSTYGIEGFYIMKVQNPCIMIIRSLIKLHF